MKICRKLIVVFNLVILSFLFFSQNASALETETNYDDLPIGGEIDISQIEPYLSEDIKEFFSNEDIDIENITDLKNMDLGSLFRYIKDTVIEDISAPVRFMASIFILVFISSLITSLSSDIVNKEFLNTFEIICVLTAVIKICEPIYDCFVSVCDFIRSAAEFMMVFVPVFSSAIMLSSGEALASGYNMTLFSLCTIIIEIAGNFIIPVLSMCLALSIVDAVNPVISLRGILKSFNKIVTISIKIILSVFVGLISVQSILGNASDGIGNRAIKMLISNSIPVVGSALSEAYGTVRNSMAIFRSCIGIFGIVVIGLILLPIIIKVVIYRFTIMLSQTISELFDAKIFMRLFDNLDNVFSITFALLVSVIIIFIIAISIAIVFSGMMTPI